MANNGADQPWNFFLCLNVTKPYSHLGITLARARGVRGFQKVEGHFKKAHFFKECTIGIPKFKSCSFGTFCISKRVQKNSGKLSGYKRAHAYFLAEKWRGTSHLAWTHDTTSNHKRNVCAFTWKEISFKEK